MEVDAVELWGVVLEAAAVVVSAGGVMAVAENTKFSPMALLEPMKMGSLVLVGGTSSAEKSPDDWYTKVPASSCSMGKRDINNHLLRNGFMHTAYNNKAGGRVTSSASQSAISSECARPLRGSESRDPIGSPLGVRSAST